MSVETLLGAVLGAILSLALPRTIDWVKLSKAHGIEGDWYSVWQPKSVEKPDWIREKVKIFKRFGRLYLKNYENEFGYKYEGIGKLIDRRHLVGNWHSVRDGAYSSGVFVLTSTPQGTCLYGEIVGPNDEGIVTAGRFVLAKTEEDLEVGKRMIDMIPMIQTRLKAQLEANESQTDA